MEHEPANNNELPTLAANEGEPTPPARDVLIELTQDEFTNLDDLGPDNDAVKQWLADNGVGKYDRIVARMDGQPDRVVDASADDFLTVDKAATAEWNEQQAVAAAKNMMMMKETPIETPIETALEAPTDELSPEVHQRLKRTLGALELAGQDIASVPRALALATETIGEMMRAVESDNYADEALRRYIENRLDAVYSARRTLLRIGEDTTQETKKAALEAAQLISTETDRTLDADDYLHMVDTLDGQLEVLARGLLPKAMTHIEAIMQESYRSPLNTAELREVLRRIHGAVSDESLHDATRKTVRMGEELADEVRVVLK